MRGKSRWEYERRLIQVENYCPFCRGEVEPEASKCPHCLSRIKEFKICPDCLESVAEEASVCRFCGHRWKMDVDEARSRASRNDVLKQIWADNLGAMVTEPSITALFFPPELTITRAEAHLVKWSFMGLRTYRQRISTERIASVRTLRGVFWSGIVIETYGGSSSDLVITGLRKKEAQETAALLEGLSGDNPSG
jgi:hypothetical protein